MEKKEFTKEQKEQMEKVFKDFLSIVDDPNRPGLVETPKRVVKYWCELLEGQLYTNKEIAEMYNKCFDLDTDEDDSYLSIHKLFCKHSFLLHFLLWLCCKVLQDHQGIPSRICKHKYSLSTFFTQKMQVALLHLLLF